MRILHTSDWHLGRTFHGLDLLDDQAHALAQIVEIARETRPDLVVIAGDLYDRVVPPLAAVELMDEILSRLVIDLGLSTIAIAGNHDAAERVGFGARLLTQAGLHLVGVASKARPIVRTDKYGEVAIHPLPFALAEQVRADLHERGHSDQLIGHEHRFQEGGAARDPLPAVAEGSSQARPHQLSLLDSARAASSPDDAWAREIQRGISPQELALRAQIQTSMAQCSSPSRHVAIAHAFVAGGAASESERDLAVGGSGAVPASVFDPFAYVALGHLHRAQSVSRSTIRYSGSLLPYSFSEVDPKTGAPQRKSISIVELGAWRPSGVEVSIEEVKLHPRRALRIVEGTFEELLGSASPKDLSPQHALSQDYILARLCDEQPILDALPRLRAVYPNILKVERVARAAPEIALGRRAQARERLSLRERFAAFFELVRERPMDPAEDRVVADILADPQLQDELSALGSAGSAESGVPASQALLTSLSPEATSHAETPERGPEMRTDVATHDRPPARPTKGKSRKAR